MKKLITVLVVGLCMTTTLAFADHNYKERNIFNALTDWSVTVLKPSAEKQDIIDQRVERRAEIRKAHDIFNKKKYELNAKYKEELLAISNQNDSAEVMARKLKDAHYNYKIKLEQLRKGELNV